MIHPVAECPAFGGLRVDTDCRFGKKIEEATIASIMIEEGRESFLKFCRMNTLTVVVVISALVTIIKADMYTDRYDSINVNDVISNKRLLIAYVKCILDKGRCTPEGKELKSHITDALQSGCKKCTEKQRVDIKKVMKHLIHKEKKYWSELVEMYDPERIYSKMYEKELGSI
ncbi:allergen Tha p 1-like [Battus philenor]|uniref:allergen Tha p 1-like n=1 Tax=Battus philenor TaxID=42288 RepID=UPI0035D0F56F